MTRDEMIDAVEYLLDPTNPEWNQAIALWHLKRRFHVSTWQRRSGMSRMDVPRRRSWTT